MDARHRPAVSRSEAGTPGSRRSAHHLLLTNLGLRCSASESVNKVLLGNKADSSGSLVDKKVVSTELGQALADRFAMRFFETSAKNSINVEEAFYAIARDIKVRLMDGPTAGGPKGVKLGGVNQGAVRKACC